MDPQLTSTFLIDSSAWARLGDDHLPDSRADEIVDDFLGGRLAVCLPFLLEAGISARNGDEHAALTEDLDGLPSFAIDPEVERRAFLAQAQLSRIGHHRIPISDVIIAAVADRHEIGVLHYDKDFDVLLEKTGLDFASVWLMPPGSIP